MTRFKKTYIDNFDEMDQELSNNHLFGCFFKYSNMCNAIFK